MSVAQLTQDDARYPRELMVVEDPPKVLYAEGNLDLLQQPRVSVIGSRHPSEYGDRIAYESARTLAARGVVIVSGMALGLDARAHRGALDAAGGTIAVLGTGIDVIYPLGNRELLEAVRERGLLLSERAPGEPPRPWNFPARNRIIAALCHCLLVVEGRAKGGTSNTAEWALRVGATIFGVPGRLGDPLAESPNFLIQAGGTIYTGPNDILLKLNLPTIPEAAHTRPDLAARIEAARQARVCLSGAEATLFDLMSHAPVHVDSLASKSSIDTGLLLAALSSLELQGLVKQLPGKNFALAS
ncbi:MAG TPA: DNA-processing protein DprA [Gemmatimonadales bacterium]|jgi:DNA processing protein